eukprot:Hpha_TRINITY_DN16692_c1_g4::TRINITY_DN16692_c1_g4_i2::g.180265::m.180265/K07208/RHEB; Ras homolog enriched in brain
MGNLCSPEAKQTEREARRPGTQPDAYKRSGGNVASTGALSASGRTGRSARPPGPGSTANSPHGDYPPGVAAVTKQRKVCVLGKGMVGKSALCIQYVEDRFEPHYEPTIQNSYTRKENYKGQEYVFTILDAAGQDECDVFQPQFALGTHAYLIVFSISDFHSFELAPFLYDKVRDCNLDDVAVVLVGNKSDLAGDREVPVEEAMRLAQSWGCPYVECSAKDSEQVRDVFVAVLGEILKREL